MGLKANVVNATFDTIIPGLAAGKYDVGASSFTDTKEREKTVDFVTYFTAGTSFYAKTSANRASTRSPTCAATRWPSRRARPSRKTRRRRARSAPRPARRPSRCSPSRPERRQPGALERPRGGRDGRLAGRRLPGQAVQRPVQAGRPDLRHGAVRDRDPEGQRTGDADARRAQGADGRRHLHAILTKWGVQAGAITTRRSTARRAEQGAGVPRAGREPGQAGDDIGACRAAGATSGPSRCATRAAGSRPRSCWCSPLALARSVVTQPALRMGRRRRVPVRPAHPRTGCG